MHNALIPATREKSWQVVVTAGGKALYYSRGGKTDLDSDTAVQAREKKKHL